MSSERIALCRQRLSKDQGFAWSSKFTQALDVTKKEWKEPEMDRQSSLMQDMMTSFFVVSRSDRWRHAREPMRVDASASREKVDPMILDAQEEVICTESYTPLIDQICQATMETASQPTDSQPAHRITLFTTLVQLSLKEVEYIVKAIPVECWRDDVLVDLCAAMVSVENTISHPCGIRLCQLVIVPKIVSNTTSVSRLLMNALHQLDQHLGLVVVDGIIVPLLINDKQHRHVVESVHKLIHGLDMSARQILLSRIMDAPWFRTQERDRSSWVPSMQALLTLIGSHPLIKLDPTIVRSLVSLAQSVVILDQKDKESMQLLLALTSKHGHELADTQLLDTLEETANMSTVFLKRAVLGQVVAIRKRLTLA